MRDKISSDTEAVGNPYRAALRSLRGAAIAAGSFSALINILMLTGSIYMLQVYDRVLSSRSVATLQGLFLIVIILYIFYGLYEFLRSRILARAAIRLDMMVGPAAFRSWLRSGIAGEKAATLPLRDLEILRGFLSGPAMGGLFDLPWIPIYLGVLFLIHPLLGWLTVAGAAIVVAVALVNRWLTRGSIDRAMGQDAISRNFADQGLRNAELIEALGMQGNICARWREMHVAGLATGQITSDRSEATSAFSKAFRMFLQSAMLTLGAFLVLRHEISAGMIIATSVLSGRALAPVDQVIGQWRSIGRAGVAHRRLQAFFDEQAPTPERVRLPKPMGRISVARLTRLAPDSGTGAERARILSQIGFDLEPGDGLGVIGNSASGKSTLARLIVGAWQPDAGEIRFDGATRTQWDPATLGRWIGYMPQSVELLPGTVRDNITRFSPEARDADMIEAAKIAGVHEMILALPQGYATLVGGPSQPLSGGQIQRLGLARAIFGPPQIVVLDEPNSNLDTNGNAALAQAIRTLRERGTTVILMTHRINVLDEMNKVLVLQKGMMAKFGERNDVLRGMNLGAVLDGHPFTEPVRGKPPLPSSLLAAARAGQAIAGAGIVTAGPRSPVATTFGSGPGSGAGLTVGGTAGTGTVVRRRFRPVNTRPAGVAGTETYLVEAERLATPRDRKEE